MALWSKFLDPVDCREADGHEDELINNDILDSYLPREELSEVPIRGYVTSSEVEKLMKDNIMTAVEVATGPSSQESWKRRLSTYSR